MLSIIVSTYRIDYINALQLNIENTIGSIAFELIRVENNGIMSLAQAYNFGAKKARFDYLLFLHEDVEFLNSNWGETLLRYLDIENIGICGLAGSRKQFKLPVGYETGLRRYSEVFVSQRKIDLLEGKRLETKIPVKTLDGVFLAMPKTIWDEFKFNETIKGYHFYDLDISLRVSEKYQNYVAPEIVLYHFSYGNFGDVWLRKAMQFYRQNYNFDKMTNEELNYLRRFWYRRLKREKISFLNRIMYLFKLGVGKNSKRAAWGFLSRI